MPDRDDVRVVYDNDYDILYLNVGKPAPSYADGIEIGVNIRHDMFTEKVTGAVIEGYSQKDKKHLKKILPKILKKHLPSVQKCAKA